MEVTQEELEDMGGVRVILPDGSRILITSQNGKEGVKILADSMQKCLLVLPETNSSCRIVCRKM